MQRVINLEKGTPDFSYDLALFMKNERDYVFAFSYGVSYGVKCELMMNAVYPFFYNF